MLQPCNRSQIQPTFIGRNTHCFLWVIPALIALSLLTFQTLPAQAQETCYVSNAGDDSSDGHSPETAWKTIARVNDASVKPGSSILFRRGDLWREILHPHSGDSSGYVTYGAYGTGEKPLLLGSVERNDPAAWTSNGNNIWKTSLSDCQRQKALYCDTGNIIFDNGKAFGVKVWKEVDLDQQGEYWFDEKTLTLNLYSTDNPASLFRDIECALRLTIIEQNNTSYVVYENLALKYGGVHGIGGGNTHHTIVRDCDFSYLGGSDQYGGDRTVRLGNGVEFWGNAHDNLVERCCLWEIYDAALTNQSLGESVQQYNITYRNNLIWNCEYSFEYWNRPSTSSTHHIYFENNTCLNAGMGWSHAQRPDPSGRHLCFYDSDAPAKDIYIRNNIFFEAKGNAFYAPQWPADSIRMLNMDHNCWFQSAGNMVSVNGKNYTMGAFSAYQAEWNKEPHSLTSDPLVMNAIGTDFHLTAGSPCLDAGTDTGITEDFAHNPRPVDIPGIGGQGKKNSFDIGAYESALTPPSAQSQ